MTWVKPYRHRGQVMPIGLVRFLVWELVAFEPDGTSEPQLHPRDVEALVTGLLERAGTKLELVRAVGSEIAGTSGLLVNTTATGYELLEALVREGWARYDRRPYANTSCPACGSAFDPLPKSKKRCKHCGTAVRVLTGADARRHLVADDDREGFKIRDLERHAVAGAAWPGDVEQPSALLADLRAAGTQLRDTAGHPACEECKSAVWSLWDERDSSYYLVSEDGWIRIVSGSGSLDEPVFCLRCGATPPRSVQLQVAALWVDGHDLSGTPMGKSLWETWSARTARD